MIRIPILRAGQPYYSLNEQEVKHIATGEPFARVSQANSGLISRDLNRAEDNRRALLDFSVEELIQICHRAADHFVTDELPVGDDGQTPEDYVRQVSGTTGLPQVMVQANMDKIRKVLAEMEQVLDGLSRGLDLGILDRGWGQQHGRALSYVAQSAALAAVLPSNSPGVHSLWLPAIPLKVGLCLKPGGQEPWTPYRIAQAFIKAGCPPSAFGYYPTDHGGASQMLLRCQRSLFFGAASSVAAWQDDPGVQIHGPGYSKVLIGPDRLDGWEEDLEVLTDSIAINGGRSCINASGVWVTGRGREVADRLAAQLAQIEARGLDDPQAQLAAFGNPEIARRIDAMIDSRLQGGAEDMTARHRQGPRLVEKDGCTFLLPTVVYCQSADHPLANSEFLFPFAAVVEAPSERIVEDMGPTLVLSALTSDAELVSRLLAAPTVERLNIGSLPTNRISWDQPHEGNLFEFLYQQRAFQTLDAAVG
jgi:acyl-CoA reductase-like NAD-dependent aldehyde dehydrogenase